MSNSTNLSRFRETTSSSRTSPPKRGARVTKVKQGLDEEAQEEIKEAFNLFDTDGSGNIIF